MGSVSAEIPALHTLHTFQLCRCRHGTVHCSDTYELIVKEGSSCQVGFYRSVDHVFSATAKVEECRNLCISIRKFAARDATRPVSCISFCHKRVQDLYVKI